MKIFLTLIIIFFIIGCNSNNDVDKTAKNTSTLPIAAKNTSTSTSSIVKELTVKCVIDSQILKVSCETNRTSENSKLEWSNVDSGKTGGGTNFEFTIYEFTPQIQVNLKECINNDCQEIEKLIDISHLASSFQAQDGSSTSASKESYEGELAKELKATCQLDSDKLEVICKTRRTSKSSELNWTNGDTSSIGEKYKFSLIGGKSITEPTVRIQLEECINSSCNKTETLIDVSHLAALIKPPDESYTIQSEEDEKNKVRTMQSEYSQGICDPKEVNYLESPPINPASVTLIRPMGGYGGDHITPIDHIYVHYKLNETHDILAMADGYLVHIGYTGIDHRIIIEYSCDLYSIYIHVSELDKTIENKLEWTSSESEGRKRSYSRIPVKKGQVIGKANHRGSFDVSVVDTRVTLTGFSNPLTTYKGEIWKFHCVDPFDYWKGDFRQVLLNKTITVNNLPPGGKIDYDIEGKVIGNWYLEGSGGFAGKPNKDDIYAITGKLSIAPHNLIDNTMIIHFGRYWAETDYSGSRVVTIKNNTPHPKEVGVGSGLIKFEYLDFLRETRKDGTFTSGLIVASTKENWDDHTYPDGGKLEGKYYKDSSGILLVEMPEKGILKMEIFHRKTKDEVSGFTDNYKIYIR